MAEYEEDEGREAEQRKELRWNIPIPVFIKGVRNDGADFKEETITTDASPSGMCVLLTQELRKGDRVTVTAPEESFESTAAVSNVSALGPSMYRIRVFFPQKTRFARDSAAKKYIYDYAIENWVGYILDGIYYNSKHEPFGKIEDTKIVSLDSETVLFRLRAGRAYDTRGKCIGHII